MQILNSKIVNVTVFADRAQIQKIAEVEIEKGDHVLRFENLPKNVESKSVQVNGKGNALLKNIKFKKEYFAETSNDKLQKLKKEEDVINYKIDELNNVIENAEKELEFIENIAQKTVQSGEKSKPELDPESWMKMVGFYRTKLDELNKEIREKNIELEKEENILSKIESEISQFGNESTKIKNVVDVVVVVEEKTKIGLLLSYIVYGAGWKPVYNARISSDRKVLLEYNATIVQNTGEDWKDVSVKLSTAQVQIGGQLPQIKPWYIDVFDEKPLMAPKEEKIRSFAKSKKKSSKMLDSFDDIISTAHTIKKPKVKVKNNETSSVFETTGKYTILSDNLESTVTISLEEFEAKFNYFATPKLSPIAYLIASVKNSSNFALLSGGINVFFENNFVAETKLKNVLPNNEFKLSLGVDEGVHIEYKLLKKYNKHEGVFTKKNVQIYEYLTIIQNSKETGISISIKDNIPVSRNDNIKVDLIVPKYKEDTENLKIDKQGLITQDFILDSKEERKIQLKFEVEYQKDLVISGL